MVDDDDTVARRLEGVLHRRRWGYVSRARARVDADSAKDRAYYIQQVRELCRAVRILRAAEGLSGIAAARALAAAKSGQEPVKVPAAAVQVLEELSKRRARNKHETLTTAEHAALRGLLRHLTETQNV